jgi:hypothetical protein
MILKLHIIDDVKMNFHHNAIRNNGGITFLDLWILVTFLIIFLITGCISNDEQSLLNPENKSSDSLVYKEIVGNVDRVISMLSEAKRFGFSEDELGVSEDQCSLYDNAMLALQSNDLSAGPKLTAKLEQLVSGITCP